MLEVRILLTDQHAVRISNHFSTGIEDDYIGYSDNSKVEAALFATAKAIQGLKK